MTPKEKAKELYNKMLQWQTDGDKFIKRNIISISAKHSALIAVDEIIKQENHIVPQLIKIIRKLMENRKLNEKFIGDVNEYWKQVKYEIEQL